MNKIKTRMVGRLACRCTAVTLAVAALGLAAAAQSLASANDPWFASGAVSCPADASRAGSFSMGAPSDGTVAGGWLTISDSTSQSFSWALTPVGVATVDMAIVIVQGGGQSAVYTYDYLTAGSRNADRGLFAPAGPSVSKIEFCFDDKDLRTIINNGGSGAGGGGSSSGGGGGGSSSGGGGAAPDLAITGVVQPVVPRVGDTLVWRLNVVDKNLAPATGLKVTVALEGGQEFVEGKTDRGPGCKAADSTNIVCDLDYLSGDSPIGNIILFTKAKSRGQLAITATASSSVKDIYTEDNTLTLAVATAGADGEAPASSRILLHSGTKVKGKLIKGSYRFRTVVRVLKAASVTLLVEDARSGKRSIMLPGTKVGIKAVLGRNGLVLVTKPMGTGRRGVLVIVPKSALKSGRAYRLSVSAKGVYGDRETLEVPVSV